jgi:hypothetical protein
MSACASGRICPRGDSMAWLQIWNFQFFSFALARRPEFDASKYDSRLTSSFHLSQITRV